MQYIYPDARGINKQIRWVTLRYVLVTRFRAHLSENKLCFCRSNIVRKSFFMRTYGINILYKKMKPTQRKDYFFYICET